MFDKHELELLIGGMKELAIGNWMLFESGLRSKLRPAECNARLQTQAHYGHLRSGAIDS
jgi:hypothetical protein